MESQGELTRPWLRLWACGLGRVHHEPNPHAVSEDAVRFSDLKLRGGGEADIDGGHQLAGGD